MRFRAEVVRFAVFLRVADDRFRADVVAFLRVDVAFRRVDPVFLRADVAFRRVDAVFLRAAVVARLRVGVAFLRVDAVFFRADVVVFRAVRVVFLRVEPAFLRVDPAFFRAADVAFRRVDAVFLRALDAFFRAEPVLFRVPLDRALRVDAERPPDSELSSSDSSSPISFFATATAAGTAIPSAAPVATFCGVDRPPFSSSSTAITHLRSSIRVVERLDEARHDALPHDLGRLLRQELSGRLCRLLGKRNERA